MMMMVMNPITLKSVKRSCFNNVSFPSISVRLAGRQGTQFGTFRGIFIKVVANTGEVVGTMVPPRGYKTITCGFNVSYYIHC